MSAPAPRPSAWNWVYTHNPFYAISAACMLYAVRSAYATMDTLEIGEINCWMMMGALGGYTLLLAVIAVFIVRWGKVWEDARSLLLLLLLLFLAVSISADDLFGRLDSAAEGAKLLIAGLVFSVLVSEGVVRGAGIRLGLLYRVPYYLLLGLFYVTPWFFAPEVVLHRADALEWLLLAFPMAAAVLFLGLLPAVHRGAKYVSDSGTPWPWPWFPGTAFGVIAGAVALRSYVLSMTFGLNGPIWHYVSGKRFIVFNTVWGTYFLVPLALAILVLLLEVALVSRNRQLARNLLLAAPLLLLLAIPVGGAKVFREFLQTVISTIGSPVWLTTWMLLAFYVWSWVRRVEWAGCGIVAMLGLLAIVGPETIGVRTFIEPQAWPFFTMAALLFGYACWNRQSYNFAGAVLAAAAGLWLWLPETPMAAYRFATCYHVLWLAFVVLGLVFRDRLAEMLTIVAAFQMPAAALAATISPQAIDVPLLWRMLYVVALTALCLMIAWTFRSRWYRYAFAATLAVAAYFGTVLGFRSAVAELGRAAMTAFAWSLGTLLLAFLISAHKARWLPPRLLNGWRNGSGPSGAPAADDAAAIEGASPAAPS